jgi:[ribosomal protein S18]-alanine N-acetyltransferase
MIIRQYIQYAIASMSRDATELPLIMAIDQHASLPPWSQQQWMDSIAAEHLIFVCKHAEQVMGFLVMMPVVDDLEILSIAVSPQHQRQGCGSALLSFALDYAKQYGFRKLLLEVRASNNNAIHLYSKHQFKQTGLRKNYYRLSTGREDALLFEREIA